MTDDQTVRKRPSFGSRPSSFYEALEQDTMDKLTNLILPGGECSREDILDIVVSLSSLSLNTYMIALKLSLSIVGDDKKLLAAKKFSTSTQKSIYGITMDAIETEIE